MRFQNRSTSTPDEVTEMSTSARSTRRKFLRYLGVGATSTALVSGAQALLPATALAATRTGSTNIAHFAPTGKPSGVNILLVHGFWADGTSWSRVIPLLLAAGHTVFAAQIPLTVHLADDVNKVLGVLQLLSGPTVLVGHSYGGSVITNAGAGQPNVTALVYISAFAPDLGEVLGQFPTGPGLANVFPVTYPGTDGTFLFFKQQKFRESFAQDVDINQANLMATVQTPPNVAILSDPTTAVAWKTLPSWYLLSTNDQLIPPATQQMFASRMKATTISVPSSHASLVSHPIETFELIQAAARVSAMK